MSKNIPGTICFASIRNMHNTRRQTDTHKHKGLTSLCTGHQISFGIDDGHGILLNWSGLYIICQLQNKSLIDAVLM